MAPIVIKILLAAGVGTALAYAAGSKQASAKSLPPKAPPDVTTIPGLTDASSNEKIQKAQQILSAASKANTPEAYSAAAYQLEQMGMAQAAAAAREVARNLSQAKGPPPTSEQPHTTVEPKMPADLSAEVARVLRDSQDPTTLDALAVKLRQLGYDTIADQLSEKAKQVRDVLATAATMQQIDNVIKSPGVAEAVPGMTVTAVVPKTQREIAANNATRAIFSAINAAGGDLKAAKKRGIVAQSQVLAFQSTAGLKQDGKAGPGTMLEVARTESALPPVLYWPTSATSTTVAKYRASLEAMADQADAGGDRMRAAALRASAADEHGQGGIVGPLLT